MLFSTCFSFYLSSQDSFTPSREGVLPDWSSIVIWQPVPILPPTCSKLSHGPTKVSASWFYISFSLTFPSPSVLYLQDTVRGSNAGVDNRHSFLQKVQICSGDQPPLIRRVSGSYSGRFTAGAWSWPHTPLSSAKVKNEWSYASTPSIHVFRARIQKALPFTENTGGKKTFAAPNS